MRNLAISVFLIALVVSACSGSSSGSDTQAVRFDIGGFVAYVGNPSVGLGGTAVTLLDAGGDIFVATTGSSGLWSIDNLRPGAYTERYEHTGYEPSTGSFALEAFGENDVSNPFVSRPNVLLEELQIRASVEPFGLVLADGETLSDGIGGQTINYSLNSYDDVIVSLNMPAMGGFAVVDDMSTGDFVIASLDSSNATTFRVHGLDIEGMNAGAGLTPTSASLDWQRVRISASAYTPLHGDLVSIESTIQFTTVP